jgi:hypothetical protein
MNTKLIKFTTGEETIFEIVNDARPDSIIVKNGLTMVFNGSSIQAIPFSVNLKDGTELSISRDKIIFITDPRDDLGEQYESQFSTIIQPPKGIVTQL